MDSNDSWSGWIAFAGIMLLIVGSIDVLQGLALIIDDSYLQQAAEHLDIASDDAWGWAILIWGGVLILAAFGLFRAATWARWMAIFAAALGAVGEMAFLSNFPNAYPLWNITILTLEIVVIYALIAKWEGYKETAGPM